MISFVVPAHNEEALIGPVLAALNDAGSALGQRFEVVVADDTSTDRTAEIAHAHGARVVRVQNRQIAATRNAGARAARGEVLVFVDADTVVSRAVVRGAVQALQAGAVGGGAAFRFDGRVPLYGRILQDVGGALYRLFRLASGCFLFCTREAFEAAGGFDEGLFAAEELAMSRALHRQGRFVVLRDPVTTSGRKVRAYSAPESLGLLARLALGRGRGVRQRKGLEIWYAERRPDPALREDPEGAPRSRMAATGRWRQHLPPSTAESLGDAMTTTPTIRNCPLGLEIRCPKRWDELTATAVPDVRHCDRCHSEVFYCATDEEAMTHARAGHCIARDIPDASGTARSLGRPELAARLTGRAAHGRGARMPADPAAFLLRWHRVVADRDLDGLATLLADEVTLGAPPYWSRFEGRPIVQKLLGVIVETIEGFTYHREWVNGSELALEFRGRLGDLELQGIDLITLDDRGRVARLDVMIRPMNALVELQSRVAGRMAG